MSDISTSEPWHDPELPFLAVLEQEVRRKAQRAAFQHEQRERRSMGLQHRQGSGVQRLGHESPSARWHASRDSEGRRLRTGAPPGSLRIARRSLTLVALLCLIAASAYGASKVFSDKPSNLLMPNRGPLVPVAQGASDHDAWSLRLYARGGELCRVLSVAEGEVSQCAGAPASDGVEATSELSPWNRYLFGIAGAGVRDVRVRLGARSRTVPTRSLSSAQVRTGGLPAHVRFWVEVLPRTGGEEPTAQVQATGLAGKALGAPVPSCSETGVPGRC